LAQGISWIADVAVKGATTMHFSVAADEPNVLSSLDSEEYSEEGYILEVDSMPEIDTPPVNSVPVRNTGEMPRMQEFELDPLIDELRDAAVAKMMLDSLPLKGQAMKSHIYSFFEDE